MEQAITDYVKFLADARDAVYRLNNDQATAKQLKEQGERQEKELAAAKKAVTDSVNQTIKKRRSEIDTSYDKEIAKGQERLKKARTQRENKVENPFPLWYDDAVIPAMESRHPCLTPRKSPRFFPKEE